MRFLDNHIYGGALRQNISPYASIFTHSQHPHLESFVLLASFISLYSCPGFSSKNFRSALTTPGERFGLVLLSFFMVLKDMGEHFTQSWFRGERMQDGMVYFRSRIRRVHFGVIADLTEICILLWLQWFGLLCLFGGWMRRRGESMQRTLFIERSQLIFVQIYWQQ